MLNQINIIFLQIYIFLFWNMKSTHNSNNKKQKETGLANQQQITKIYVQIKLAITKIFQLKQIGMEDHQFQLLKKDNPRKTKKALFQYRDIIKNKQLAFLRDLNKKLKQIQVKRWDWLTKKQKLKIYLQLINAFKIIKDRLSNCIILQSIDELQLTMQKIIQGERKLLTEIDESQNKNNLHDQTSLQYFYICEKSETVTRPSSSNPFSLSSIFMQNYINNTRLKQSIGSNIQSYKKLKSHHSHFSNFIQPGDNLKCKASYLNHRNTLQQKLFDNEELKKTFKSKSIQNKALSMYQGRKKQIKKQDIKKITEGQMNKQRGKGFLIKNNQEQTKYRVKSLNKRNQVQIYRRNSKILGTQKKMVSFQQNSQFGRNNLYKHTIVKKQQQILQKGSKQKLFTNQLSKSQIEFRKNYNRINKLRKVKIKRSNKRGRTTKKNQSVQNLDNIKRKQNPDSYKIIFIQPIQNQEDKLDTEKKSNPIQTKIASYIKQPEAKQNSSINSSLSIRDQKQQQIKRNRKQYLKTKSKTKLIKRNAIIYRQGDLQKSELQRNVRSLQPQKTPRNNIFKQLVQLRQEILQCCQRDPIPVLYREQQNLRLLEQKRVMQMFNKSISPEQFFRTLNIKNSSTQKIFQNIQQYQRIYSFISDAQWIRFHYSNNIQQTLIQKFLHVQPPQLTI